MTEGTLPTGNGHGGNGHAEMPSGAPNGGTPDFSDVQLRALSVLLDRTQFAKLAGIQYGGKRDLYEVFGYDRIVTTQQYRDEYARGGIAKRIVEAFPKATWRGGVEVYEDEDPNKDTEFEKAFKVLEAKHHVWNKLQNADILAGLSTYSVILIGAPGDLETPLPKGTPDKLLFLQPFFGGGGPGDQGRSISSRTQSADADVSIDTFDVDPQSPRFGEPLTYRIRRTDLSSPMISKPVHWSRVIHVCEGALDNNVYGVPTLESVWNLLADLAKITGGGAESYFQRAKHSLNANIQKDATFTPDDLNALKAKLEEYQHGITNFLPTREVDVKLIEAAVANFAAPADAILKQIAGSKGIPMRILTGSEMGSLASEQDAENFDSQVQDRRTGYAGPMIVRKFVDRLIEFGYLPTPKQYEVGWPVEENMDEQGKAAFALSLATVNKTHDGVVFSEDEIRDMAFDKPPLEETEPFEELSESQKADIAFKLAGTNKAMGVTVFTDDEIRSRCYGWDPLPDDKKVPIGAPERISVNQPPPLELDANGKPVPGTGAPPTATGAPGTLPTKVAALPAKVPALKAAEIANLEAILEEALATKNREVLDHYLGFEALGDAPGHEFHGNQWTSGTGEANGVAVQRFNDLKDAKQAAKEAHKELTKAGFVRGEKEKKHTPSQKMGRSEAYSGASDRIRTPYVHADGRKATLIERYPKYGEKSVAIHHERTSA